MKRTRKDLKLSTETVDDFFKRSRERACKLDKGGKLPAEIRVTFEDPADLVRVLSAERVRVLHTVRTKTTKSTPISSLATILKRDRKAVSRDVKVLESFGLLKTREQLNPGHGIMKVVEPLAEKYYLTATI